MTNEHIIRRYINSLPIKKEGRTLTTNNDNTQLYSYDTLLAIRHSKHIFQIVPPSTPLTQTQRRHYNMLTTLLKEYRKEVECSLNI